MQVCILAEESKGGRTVVNALMVDELKRVIALQGQRQQPKSGEA